MGLMVIARDRVQGRIVKVTVTPGLAFPPAPVRTAEHLDRPARRQLQA
jgi:hypothetical protein